VIPLYSVDKDGHCLCGDKACKSPGKHPHAHYAPNGSKSATVDGGVIAGWFNGEEINIGIVAGQDSNLVILDVDPAHGGDESLKQFDDLPQTPSVRTGSGGRHFYFRHPGGDVRNSAGTVGRGLDVRGHHGYCVAPPSLHTSGNEYKWMIDATAPLADTPTWLLNGHTKKVQAEPKEQSHSNSIPEGQRDTQLTSIAGVLRRQGFDADAIYLNLLRVNEQRCDPPLDESQLRKIANSVGSYPAGKSEGGIRFNLSDAGNAERLAARYGDRLRYVWGWNKWLYYDGVRWNPEVGDEMARRLAVETVRNIIVEAQREPDEVRAALIKWSLTSESTHRIGAMLTAAQATEQLSAYPRQFDNDLLLFNVLNGTIDLRIDELRPHNPADMITMLSPVEYDRHARLDLWDQILATITGGDKAFQRFLQRSVGYSLTGDIGEEKMWLLHGPSATGKTTFLRAVKATLGDYATVADFESFLKRQSQNGVRNDIASLAGKRFVLSVEVDEGRRLAEGLVKILTGGDQIKARFLYSEGFEFLPQMKLWLAANHAPRVSDDDDALWRRILRIPFVHVVPETERQASVKTTLGNPAIAGPAILAWAVQGCLHWQREGLQVPDIIKSATATYRDEQDPLRDFFDDCCIFDPTGFATVKGLRLAYEGWAGAVGDKERYLLGRKSFNDRLQSRGCEQKVTRYANSVGTEKTDRCWHGITLRAEPRYSDTVENEDNHDEKGS
jgi:putative DNA primase/helicase